MSIPIWLTRRECAHRWPLLLAELAVVATAVALALGLELVGRAREAAVATQIDQMGAAIRLVPQGSSAVARQRFETLDQLLPAGALERANTRLASTARAIEPRLALLAPSSQGPMPVVGVAAAGRAAGGGLALGTRELAIGETFARQRGLGVSSTLALYGSVFRVLQVLPSRGDEDDLMAFASLADLQAVAGLPGAVNEVRLFARVGAREALERAARDAFPDAHLLVADRGQVAETDIPSSLGRFRATVFALLALAAGLGLLAAGRLSAAERSRELAILAAVGADARTLTAALLARSCLVGLAGAMVGVALAASVAFAQDAASMRALPGLGCPLALAVAAAAVLSGVTALPTVLAVTRRDPFRLLAEP